MVTPFDEKGEVDRNRLRFLVDHLIRNGTDSLVVCGTTGESPTLTDSERAAVIRETIDAAAGRVPVIAGTGSNNTASTIALTQRAEELGADGIMLVTPYYNRPDQRGIHAHFKAAAECTRLPVMLYNVPSRTASRLEPETVISLSRIPNVRALKEAGGDLLKMTEVINGTDDGFRLYSGDDGLTLPVLSIGGSGVVSVASHVAGPEMQSMIRAYREGRLSEAAKLHSRLAKLAEALFSRPSPAPVKHALLLEGINTGPVRLPLLGLEEPEARLVEQELRRFKMKESA